MQFEYCMLRWHAIKSDSSQMKSINKVGEQRISFDAYTYMKAKYVPGVSWKFEHDKFTNVFKCVRRRARKKQSQNKSDCESTQSRITFQMPFYAD